MIQRIAVAIALTLAPAAFAQTYIVPDGSCGAITLHATRGADFPNLGQTIAPDQVKSAWVSNSPSRGFDPGVKPWHLAMKPVPAARSLDFTTNVDAHDEAVMAAVDFTPVVNGNETRTEHAKAFVFCGSSTPMADWQRSGSLGLEIYPQWNGIRQRMKQGDSMRFIAVDQSTKKLLQDVPMELYRAGTGRIAEGIPSKNGGMTFPFPEPGRYMVTTTYRRPDPQQPEHWLVDTSTLTFEVK
jgi:hypothetical protein